MRTSLKVGLIGCGWFAQAVHLPILRRLPKVELIALAEPDPDRRQEARRCVPAALVYADYRDLLKMRDLDAVIVSVPPALHAEVAIAAMQLGKHVYLEKPIATSLGEADKIMSAWKQSGVVGMVGFNYRFNALHQAARMQIQAGKLGPMVGAQSVFSTPTRSMPSWKQTRSTGGGVLLELASHHIDLVRFLFQQDVRMVYADIESRCTEHDTATLHLRLADGLRVQSYFSLCAVDEDRFEIYGQVGKLTVDRYRSLDVEIVDAGGTSSRLRRVTRRLRSLRSVPYLFKKLQSPWHEPSYREALSRFVSAVRGREKASPDLLDGYRSLEVICAAEESAQTGRSVSLVPLVVDLQQETPRRVWSKEDEIVNQGKSPEMSVVIVTPDDYQVISRTIRFLRAQTVKDRLELVICAPSRKQLGLIESDLAGFHSYKVVEVGEIRILTDAKVTAVAESSAPIVAFAEDHCYPEPDWAEALIASHRRGHAAVGPLMRNANPATSLSWAGLFLHYGCCIQPVLSGRCTNLPWHNTSYKRRLLLEYGSELSSMLIVEGILFDDLRAKGHTLHFEPAAQTNHVNISILSSWVRHAFWGGKLFGAMRARKNNWPVWKRLIYIAGSPLIPVMRFYKTVQKVREVGKGALLLRMIPALLAGLLPHVVGEIIGYALGAGRAAERYSYFEMKRFLHVVPSDQKILFK